MNIEAFTSSCSRISRRSLEKEKERRRRERGRDRKRERGEKERWKKKREGEGYWYTRLVRTLSVQAHPEGEDTRRKTNTENKSLQGDRLYT